MKKYNSWLFYLFFLLFSCGGGEESKAELNLETQEDSSTVKTIDHRLPWGFTPLDCKHNHKGDCIREMPIKVSVDADFADYFIVIEGTQFVLDGSTFKHDNYVIYGNDLCLKGEFADPNNSQKDTFKIAINLNDSLFTYKLKVDDGLSSLRYDTLIPLSTWGIMDNINNGLAYQ